MVSPTKPDEGHVLFWVTEEDGREFATCAAADFRAAMTERDQLRAENERLRAEAKLDERTIEDAMGKIGELAEQRDELRAENERLRVDNDMLAAALDQIATESLDDADRSIALEALGDL